MDSIRNKYLHFSVLLITIKVALVLAAFLALYWQRVVIFIILLFLLIFDLVFGKKLMWITSVLALLAVLIVLYPIYPLVGPLYERIELERFSALKGVYDSAVSQALPEIQAMEDTGWGEYNVPLAQSLIVGREVVVMKQGEKVALYFPVRVNFFQSYGWLYASSPEAFDTLLTDIDWISWFVKEWAYVKLY